MNNPETVGSPLELLASQLGEIAGGALIGHTIAADQLTITVDASKIKEVCTNFRDQAGFEQLTDLCGVDYAHYGAEGGTAWPGERYAVVYHLISFNNNCRVRVRAPLSESALMIDSVIDVWAGADWFEREAFDLFGIIFQGHPDLRRILTDYGFIGHPFRKDFPLSGNVEMRYDEEQKRVIYQPVTIAPRTLVPRTIRKDVFASSSAQANDASDQIEAN